MIRLTSCNLNERNRVWQVKIDMNSEKGISKLVPNNGNTMSQPSRYHVTVEAEKHMLMFVMGCVNEMLITLMKR